MHRRDLITKGSAGILVAAATVLLPHQAKAGKGWCRMDPYAEFDGQLVEFYGDAYTEDDFSTIVPGSAIFDIYRPSLGSHTFNLTEVPDCEVNYHNTAYWGYAGYWVIHFQFMTTNGDNLGRLQTIPHESGRITAKTQNFSNYAGFVTF